MLYSLSVENSERAVFYLPRLDRRFYQRAMQLFAAVSTFYGFWIIYDMDHYLPWQVRFAKGVEITLIAHFGLWLAAFKIRGRVRFLAVGPMLLSLAGVFLLWWTLDLSAAIVALGCVSWLFFLTLRGKRLGD